MKLVVCRVCCFKKKTADEMRISDWSSDVCASDLPTRSACGSMSPSQADWLSPGRCLALSKYMNKTGSAWEFCRRFNHSESSSNRYIFYGLMQRPAAKSSFVTNFSCTHSMQRPSGGVRILILSRDDGL